MLHCLYAALCLVQKQLTTMLIANGFLHSNLERQATHNHPEQNNASKIQIEMLSNKKKLKRTYKAHKSTSDP